MDKSQNPKLDSQIFFIESTYQGQRRIEKCYLLTRKGCDMVANKLTGEKGRLFIYDLLKRKDILPVMEQNEK